ncbi:hypothetical protein ABE44_35735 [Bacillus thuringiensis]|nr:hypothetical protein [Bacillus thuringiensis]MBG9504198.1 hypothetical protein [Bacillus thuringiensis]MBG9508271.1 hypothetical protein [Bacillus thuringiensis]
MEEGELSEGNTINFYLSKFRNQKALQVFHASKPCGITVDKKEQIYLQNQSVQNQKQFIHQLFRLTG